MTINNILKEFLCVCVFLCFAWKNWWLTRRGRRTGKFNWASWQSLHSLRHGDKCREDQADDKQHQWHQPVIKVNGQKLETVASFKYLDSVKTDEGSKPEILSRIAQTTAALTRFKPIWFDKSISLSSKIRLMRSLFTSIFLYACESWTLTAELQRRTQAMELQDTTHLIQSPCYQWGSRCQDPVGN